MCMWAWEQDRSVQLHACLMRSEQQKILAPRMVVTNASQQPGTGPIEMACVFPSTARISYTIVPTHMQQMHLVTSAQRHVGVYLVQPEKVCLESNQTIYLILQLYLVASSPATRRAPSSSIQTPAPHVAMASCRPQVGLRSQHRIWQRKGRSYADNDLDAPG